MPELDAPARLMLWSDFVGTDDGHCFATLREALSCLPDDPGFHQWIVTESGKILRPGEIAALKAELAGG